MSAIKLGRERLASTRSDHERIAQLARALAHPARVQIVQTLLRRTTCIGCDIVEEIGLAASTTSEHLRILKEAGFNRWRNRTPAGLLLAQSGGTQATGCLP
jgi:predicted transcriptional regulator